MEYLVEKQSTEQIKIFVALKKLFSAGGAISKRYEGVELIKYRLQLDDDWVYSVYNNFKTSHYFKIYCKRFDGNIVWIAVARESGRQYIIKMKKNK